MATTTLAPVAVIESTRALSSRAAESVKTKIDDGLVRFDAWFLVFVAVIISLGATLLVGMAIWCMVKQGKSFTGRWEFKNWGLKVYFECR